MSANEFSRTVELETLTEPKTFDIEADAGERDRLAKRFGLEGLLTFSARLTLTPNARGTEAHLTGTIDADVRQRCVVTLEPFDSHLNATVDVTYSRDAEWFSGPEPLDEGDESDLGAPLGDAPEPIEGGIIDLGEAAAQTLGLELDPFPRIPGAVLPEGSEGGKGAAVGPFAKLAQLRPPEGGRNED